MFLRIHFLRLIKEYPNLSRLLFTRSCVTFWVTCCKEMSITHREMLIAIPNKRLRRSIEDDVEARKRFGLEMAKKIHLRMGALVAAESLGVFWPPFSPPERCHELKGELAGVFSMDLTHPYRLLFKPLKRQQELGSGSETKQGALDQRRAGIQSIQLKSSV